MLSPLLRKHPLPGYLLTLQLVQKYHWLALRPQYKDQVMKQIKFLFGNFLWFEAFSWENFKTEFTTCTKNLKCLYKWTPFSQTLFLKGLQKPKKPHNSLVHHDHQKTKIELLCSSESETIYVVEITQQFHLDQECLKNWCCNLFLQYFFFGERKNSLIS